jgi:hypothetical protein
VGDGKSDEIIVHINYLIHQFPGYIFQVMKKAVFKQFQEKRIIVVLLSYVMENVFLIPRGKENRKEGFAIMPIQGDTIIDRQSDLFCIDKMKMMCGTPTVMLL